MLDGGMSDFMQPGLIPLQPDYDQAMDFDGKIGLSYFKTPQEGQTFYARTRASCQLQNSSQKIQLLHFT